MVNRKSICYLYERNSKYNEKNFLNNYSSLKRKEVSTLYVCLPY